MQASEQAAKLYCYRTKHLEWQPYFYIIRHTKSGKKYAGIKYSKKDANPTLLLARYKTSSETVNRMLEANEEFVIEEVKLARDMFPSDQKSMISQLITYEKNFLHSIKASASEEWLNENNGGGYPDRTGISIPLSESHRDRISKGVRNSDAYKIGIANRTPMIGDLNPSKRDDVRAKISEKKKGTVRSDILGDSNPSKQADVRKKISESRKKYTIYAWFTNGVRNSQILAIDQEDFDNKVEKLGDTFHRGRTLNASK